MCVHSSRGTRAFRISFRLRMKLARISPGNRGTARCRLNAVVYYDPNPHVAGRATLVAELDNVTNFSDLQKFTVTDFHLI
jgi:hypothetical protein